MRALYSCLALLGFVLAVLAADGLPLGHPDYYPSPERPLGWRGDGTGAWPGAAGVITWNPETGQNVAWKAALPGAGMAQPLVVGEKVFVTADPNLLVCLNVHDGTILWQTAIDHTTAMTPEQAAKAREEIAFFAARWREYSQWRIDLVDFEAQVVAAKLKTGVLWLPVQQTKILAVKDGDADFTAIMAVPDLKATWDRLFKLQEEYGYRVLTGNNSPLIKPDSGLTKRWREANAAYDIWFADNWEGFGTWSFPTPCTDGELVYVTTVNNAVAAVDLHGKIRWLVWEHRDGKDRLGRTGGQLGTRYIASPLLADGKLVVNQNGEFRVYDAKTGKKVWGIVNPYEKLGIRKLSQFPWRPTPESPTPCLLRLPLPGGESLATVADGGNLLFRLDDGKVLSTAMPFMAKGASPIGAGQDYFWTTGADGPVTVSGGVMRVTATDRDTVKLEKVWECVSADFKAQLQPAATSIVHEGRWYACFGGKGRKACSIDPTDGSAKDYTQSVPISSCSPIIVGQCLYSFPQGDFWKRWSSEVDGTMSATIVDLKTGKATSLKPAFIDRRIFEYSDFALRNRYVACGGQITNASPSAQANRIFHRTKGYLWCIGDPKEPFPTPKDCPADARAR
jgi:outer membrane protein assembly factor BamB